jgi:hypothetical protein
MTRLEGGPYKDAVRFSNGVEILLQRLDVGLVAVVVGSPEAQPRSATAEAAAEPELV